MRQPFMRTVVAISLVCCSFASWAAEPTARVPAAPPLGAAEIRAHLADYFFDAARSGNQAMLREFVTSGYDLNTRTEQGYTALILAAYHGYLPVVEQLLNAGADPCAQDKRGNTALMGAIFKGEFAVARRLIQAPCKADQRNNAGQTAAMYAALFGRAELLNQLARNGADLDAQDNAGNTARALASGTINTLPSSGNTTRK
jgi:ankyrin repeat protein